MLTPWPAQPGEIERSNRATIARLGGVEVATLPHLPTPRPALLAAAGARLPLDRWVADPSTCYERPSAFAGASAAPK